MQSQYPSHPQAVFEAEHPNRQGEVRRPFHIDSVPGYFIGHKLPPEKLDSIRAELARWLEQSSCTKRQLQSLIGLLSFVAKIVPPGRTFLPRMIDLTTSVPHTEDVISLSEPFKKDLMWWRQFVAQWNGKSFFMFPKWIPNTALNLFTDSSGTIGYGAYFDGRWFQGRWSSAQAQQSIQWKELYPIVVASATWGHLWAKKRVL